MITWLVILIAAIFIIRHIKTIGYILLGALALDWLFGFLLYRVMPLIGVLAAIYLIRHSPG